MVDESEPSALPCLSSFNVGFNTGTTQAFKHFCHSLVAVTIRTPVSVDQKIVGSEPHHASHFSAPVDRLHQLADAVDPQILVVDRGAAVMPWVNRDSHAATLIGANAHISRLESKQGMFHAGHVSLRRRVQYVGHKKIHLPVTGR